MGNLKEELSKIATTLYKGRANEGIAMMSNVLEGLQAAALNMDEEAREEFLQDALAPALDAMRDKDAPLLADIITYEIMERIDA